MTPSQPDPEAPAELPHSTRSAGDASSGDASSGDASSGDASSGDKSSGDASSGDASSGKATLDRSLDLVRFLRARCDWDAAQTPRSLVPYLLEEAHETAEAIAADDDAHLAGELGDLLLNVAFQIVLGEERAAFTAEDVVASLEAKMRRRHPHLYGDGPRVDWESAKRSEHASGSSERENGGTGERGLLDGLAAGFEPLSRAQRMQERVAAVGFDWPSADGAFEKVVEEVEEVRELIDAPPAGNDPAHTFRVEEEIGDLLFAVVNLARLSGTHAMGSLVRANAKFERRFRSLEALAVERGIVLGDVGLEDLDQLWDDVKRLEAEAGG